MKRKEKALLVQATLNTLFPSPSIPLIHTTPYTLLIAVLLSAQCTDERVNRITPLLFAKASTPRQMLLLSQEEIEAVIKPCGLFRTKAKAILALSRILEEKFSGEVPSSLEDLESLPGVGHKTASVVLVQAFHRPAFPVDTHIHRVAKRWGLSKGRTVQETEKDLKKLFPRTTWGLLHLQMILYARSHCPARGHHLQDCPICLALQKN